MENLFNEFANLISISYVLSVIFGTFIVLYFFISKPPSRWKFVISAVIGIIFGIIWFLFIKEELSRLIVSFLFATGLYQWIKDAIFKTLKINYSDK